MADAGVAHAICEALPYLAKRCEIAVWCDDGMVFSYLYKHFAQTEKLDSKGKMALSKKVAQLQPDLVVTSLSKLVSGGLEDAAINAAHLLNINSVGILDKVFYNEEALKQILTERVLPAYFIVASDLMRLKLQEKIGAEDNVYALPMPKFAHYAHIPSINKGFDAAIRRLNGLKLGEFPLIFLSSHSDYDKLFLGYLSFVLGKCKNVKVLLSFHPKDDDDFRCEVLSRLPAAEQLDVGYCSTILALKTLTQRGKGAVCSFSSPLMFDVATIGGTTISLLSASTLKNSEPLAEMGLSLLADSRQKLAAAVKTIQSGAYLQKKTGFADVEAINQFIQAMCLLADY